MDRFSWTTSSTKLEEGEKILGQQSGIRIYDGDRKTTFESGNLKVTNFRLIWDDELQQDRIIALPLSYVTKLEEESSGLFKSAKTVVYLQNSPKDKDPGPCFSSKFDHIKLSFRSSGQSEFHRLFVTALNNKEWTISTSKAAVTQVKQTSVSHRHVGIGGIEKKLEEKYKKSDDSISKAFKDLDALMEKAKEMVALAEKFCSKLQEKQVSITDDETTEFKSYLLSMGIANPVTRETHGSGVKYHEELAKELSSFLIDIIEKEGGIMTLTDVYCRFNRARGMELVSPDDVINAAKQLEALRLPLRFKRFNSGVLVMQSLLHSEEELIQQTAEMVEKDGSLTTEELARALSIAVTLARERLLAAENVGKLCRDDSVEGLRFYPNRFLIT